jgi:hypothetical protein
LKISFFLNIEFAIPVFSSGKLLLLILKRICGHLFVPLTFAQGMILVVTGVLPVVAATKEAPEKLDQQNNYTSPSRQLIGSGKWQKFTVATFVEATIIDEIYRSIFVEPLDKHKC